MWLDLVLDGDDVEGGGFVPVVAIAPMGLTAVARSCCRVGSLYASNCSKMLLTVKAFLAETALQVSMDFLNQKTMQGRGTPY